MPRSLSDASVHAAFREAAQRQTREIRVGNERRPITTPFPSPQDWRDLWIYFLMLDRFNRDDGIPPASMPYDKPFGGFQGGTFNGVRAQLDYLKALGVGALWLSPVFKNRLSDAASFHGYGIQDFLRPDPRFASIPGQEEEELRALVDEAHARGMYVIFDIVLNHAGDVFAYRDFGSSAPASTTAYAVEWRDQDGRTRSDWLVIEDIPESQRHVDALVWPAELQRNRFFRRIGKGGEAGGDFESLKELATDARDGPQFPVRDALILAYQHAIARYDVDGFRIDTLKYVERDFARIFGNAMREYALSIGKKNFFTFGEVADNEEKIAEFIGRNTHDRDDLVGVDAALDFPLFNKLPAVIKGIAPPVDVSGVFSHRKLVQRNVLSSHGEASRFFVTFLDNHDMHERLRSASSDAPSRFDAQVVLGLGLLFCLQGIPCLYYGTEQGLHGHGYSDQHVREALWGKANPFDAGHLFYREIAKLSTIRATEPALRYGRLYFRPVSGNGIQFATSPFAPGVLAFSRILNNREIVVVANASTEQPFEGFVIVDLFINQDGDLFKVLNGDNVYAAGPVETRSGLDILEPMGGHSTGPARMLQVKLRPMEVQILGK